MGDIRNSQLLKVLALLSVLIVSGCDSDDPEADNEAAYSALYIFGDSLSDTGNLGTFATLGLDDLPDPFFENRISNGPVIVDWVADSLGLDADPSRYNFGLSDGNNYAVAGAQADDENNIDLAFQVDAFLTARSNDVPEDALVFMFIGGNDVIAQRGSDETNAETALGTAASLVVTELLNLVTAGARHLVVLTLPDIGDIPKIRLEEADNPGRQAFTTSLTQFYNERLANEARTRIPADVRLTVIDTFTIAESVKQNAASYGITNLTDACYDTDDLEYNAGCSESRFAEYFYFDDVHPTAVAHQAIGEMVASRIPARNASE